MKIKHHFNDSTILQCSEMRAFILKVSHYDINMTLFLCCWQNTSKITELTDFQATQSKSRGMKRCSVSVYRFLTHEVNISLSYYFSG